MYKPGTQVGLPYIKVKYKVNDPATGRKKGEVHTLGYHTFDNIPANIRENFELVEGAENAKELKLVQIERLKAEIHYKQLQIERLQDEYDNFDSEYEEDEPDSGSGEKPTQKKKTAKKRKH